MAAIFATWPFWAVLALVALVVFDRLLHRAVGLIEHLTALRGTTPEQRPPILQQLKRVEPLEKTSRSVRLPIKRGKRGG